MQTYIIKKFNIIQSKMQKSQESRISKYVSHIITITYL